METHTFFLHLLIILLSARLFAEIAVRMQLPGVIGELVAGILLGPSLLGLMEVNEVLKLLAEVGIILLLFEAGIETDIKQLTKAGPKAVIVAIGGFVVPFAGGFSAAYWWFDLPLMVSLFIGGTLTATSIGITVRVLGDIGRKHSREGQIILGAAVIDDVLGVILLALLYESATTGGVSFATTGRVMIFVTIFFLIAPIAAKFISHLIHHVEKKNRLPGLIPTTIVSLVLFFAWLAHVVGAPELLGGFAAGLALSRRFFLPFGIALHQDPAFATRIEDQMRPIVQLFTPIFFVLVGLSLNFREIDWTSPFIWGFSLIFFLIALIGKYAGAFFIRENIATRLAIGMAMVPRGEVGLIFAELGRISGIFSNEIHAGLIIVIAFTTLLAPLWMKFYYAAFGKYLDSGLQQVKEEKQHGTTKT